MEGSAGEEGKGKGKGDVRAMDAQNAGRIAAEAGLWSGLKGLAVSSVCVFLANQYWPAFRNGLNVSGKTALVVTPFFFYFSLDAEVREGDEKKKKKKKKKKWNDFREQRTFVLSVHFLTLPLRLDLQQHKLSEMLRKK